MDKYLFANEEGFSCDCLDIEEVQRFLQDYAYIIRDASDIFCKEDSGKNTAKLILIPLHTNNFVNMHYSLFFILSIQYFIIPPTQPRTTMTSLYLKWMLLRFVGEEKRNTIHLIYGY